MEGRVRKRHQEEKISFKCRYWLATGTRFCRVLVGLVCGTGICSLQKHHESNATKEMKTSSMVHLEGGRCI